MTTATSIRFQQHLREQVLTLARAEQRTFSGEVHHLLERRCASAGRSAETFSATVRRMGSERRIARGYSWPPFERGNTASLTHGATSERKIRPLARTHCRRVLRQIGLRATDLDPIGKAYLEHYCRLTAKVILIDPYVDEHGLLDEEGTPLSCMRLYVQLSNSAVAALGKLERHLAAREEPSTPRWPPCSRPAGRLFASSAHDRERGRTAPRAAEPWQLADAEAILATGGPSFHWLTRHAAVARRPIWPRSHWRR